MSLLNLNDNQKTNLRDLLNSGDYSGAYRYLRDVALGQLENGAIDGDLSLSESVELAELANYLNVAAHINSDDGSLISEFVRGSAKWQGDVKGVDTSGDWFQNASDGLAQDIVNDFIDGSIDHLSDVVHLDSNSAANELELGRADRWPGTLGDQLFLGDDFVQVEGHSPQDYAIAPD